MKISKKIKEKFIRLVESDTGFRQCLKLLEFNTKGNVWLVGGRVYRTLIQIMYGIKKENADYDFVVEKCARKLIVPAGWKLKHNKYGNPKFVNGVLEVDIIPLETVESIRERELEPTIDNYLTGTPLTVQSLAYDLKQRKLIGENGLKAVQTRTVSINNYQQAKKVAISRGVTLSKIVKQKAKGMGFIESTKFY